MSFEEILKADEGLRKEEEENGEDGNLVDGEMEDEEAA